MGTKQLSMDDIMKEILKLPDSHLYPFPDSFYEKYNIPKPELPNSINEYTSNMYNKPKCYWLPEETRPPAEGGVRKIELPEQPLLEVTYQNDDDNQQLKLEESACSKEDSNLETQHE